MASKTVHRGAKGSAKKPLGTVNGAQRRVRSSERESAAENAYRLIKSRIVSRVYAPGQFMHELAICEDIGLGRTPVHQALHRLKLEKLVTIIPRKGIMVDAVSPADIFTVLEVRELVEPYCASLAASRVTEKTIAELQNALDESRRAVIEKNQVRFMELDQRLHNLVTLTAGNGLIIEFLHSLHGRVARIWRAPSWSQQDYELTYQQHKALVDAICRGDADGAGMAMRNHIVSLRERVMKQFMISVTDGTSASAQTAVWS